MLPQLPEERLGLSVLRKTRATISNLASRYRVNTVPQCGRPRGFESGGCARGECEAAEGGVLSFRCFIVRGRVLFSLGGKPSSRNSESFTDSEVYCRRGDRGAT